MSSGATAPTLENFLMFDLAGASPLAGMALLLAMLYLVGAVRLWLGHRKWSVLRTVTFLLGCGILFG